MSNEKIKTVNLLKVEQLKDFINANQFEPLNTWVEELVLKTYQWAEAKNYHIINIQFAPFGYDSVLGILIYFEK